MMVQVAECLRRKHDSHLLPCVRSSSNSTERQMQLEESQLLEPQNLNKCCTVFGKKHLEKKPLEQVESEPSELLDRLRYQRTVKQLDPSKGARVSILLEKMKVDCQLKGIQVDLLKDSYGVMLSLATVSKIQSPFFVVPSLKALVLSLVWKHSCSWTKYVVENNFLTAQSKQADASAEAFEMDEIAWPENGTADATPPCSEISLIKQWGPLKKEMFVLEWYHAGHMLLQEWNFMLQVKHAFDDAAHAPKLSSLKQANSLPNLLTSGRNQLNESTVLSEIAWVNSAHLSRRTREHAWQSLVSYSLFFFFLPLLCLLPCLRKFSPILTALDLLQRWLMWQCVVTHDTNVQKPVNSWRWCHDYVK